MATNIEYGKGTRFRSTVEETDGGFWNSMPGNEGLTFIVGIKEGGKIEPLKGLKRGKVYEFKIVDVDSAAGFLVKPVQKSIVELTSEVEKFIEATQGPTAPREIASTYLKLDESLRNYSYRTDREAEVLAKLMQKLETSFQKGSERIFEEETRKKWSRGLELMVGTPAYAARMREISGNFLRQCSFVPFDIEPNLSEINEHPQRTLMGKYEGEVVACLSYADASKSENNGLRLENMGTDPLQPKLINLFLKKALSKFPGKFFYVLLMPNTDFRLFTVSGFVKGSTLTIKDTEGKKLEVYRTYTFSE
jgi:hypothetical protein